MKKKIVLGMAFVACLALGLCVAGCSSDGSSGASGSSAMSGEAAEGSLIAYHEGLGQDFSGVSEVSVSSCASEAACHDGSWDAVVEETDALWEGVGQIPDANPHHSHATNGFECSDCHSLAGTSVNQCNGCHNFETPDGWDEKDPTTTIYGAAEDEPLF